MFRSVNIDDKAGQLLYKVVVMVYMWTILKAGFAYLFGVSEYTVITGECLLTPTPIYVPHFMHGLTCYL